MLEIAPVLHKAPLLAGLTENQRNEVIGWFNRVTFFANREMLAEGADTHGLFVLIQGRVSVTATSPSGIHHLTELEAPAVIGEIGMLTAARRCASVQTMTGVVAAHLPRSLFESQVAANHPAALRIAYNLGRVAAERLHWTQQRLIEVQDEIHQIQTTPDVSTGLRDLLERLRKFFLGLA